MADQYLDCDGAAIAYEINGEGPLVGYAHGLFISRRMERWLRLVDWAPVRRGRRFLEYDARGHGLTGGRAISDDYLWSNMARDLLAFVDTLSPGDPIDFIGASMGTGTLLWSAVTAPHRFKRLVLAVPSTAWQTRPAQAAQYRELATVAETDGKDAVIARLIANSPPPVLAERFAELADSPEAPRRRFRTTDYIEASLYLGTQFAVFEPNDPVLWGQLRLAVTGFMRGLFRQGAFQQSASLAESDSFFVTCDDSVNPQSEIDAGRVNVVVGFAPLKPAEFVVITITQITDSGA